MCGTGRALLAALDVATGRVIGHVKDRRTSVNFLHFMDDVVAAFPRRDLHVVLDNLNIHKNAAARRWLTRHPRVQFHHTPTHASWVNLIEVFFSILGKQGLAHRVDRSKASLRAFLLAISRTVQPDERPVYVDQRAGETPAPHRRDEGRTSQWAAPQADAETCASSSE
jgi:transposase